jgi:RND superfamily putative drug exporter
MTTLRDLRLTKTPITGGTTVVSSERVVAGTTTQYDTGAPRETSPLVAPGKAGGDVTLALVKIEGDATQLRREIDPIMAAVKEAQRQSPDFSIQLGGEVTQTVQSQKVSDEDLSRSLLLNLVITMVLLLAAFGTVVAGVVPLALAFISIAVANAILAVVSQFYALSNIYAEMVLLMGLATGIDYALFVISRYRVERHHGKSKDAAILAASATSGKAVAFAGVTVLLSISGMFFVGDATFTSIAIAAIVVVALAVVASLTVLPALLGDGLNRWHVPFIGREHKEGGGIWGHICDAVLKRPVAFAAVTVAGLLLLAAPVLTLNLGFNGARALPDAVEAKKAALALQQDFTLGLTSPAVVAVDAGKNQNIFAPAVQSHVQQFVGLVQAESVSSSNPNARFGGPIETKINDAGDTAQILVPLNSDIGDKKAIATINHLRKDVVPGAFADSKAKVYVSGQAAANVDFKDNIIQRTPIVLGFVLGLAFLILLVTFHSLVIAVKAILLNLLSVGATYGILVLVFQKGWLLERPLGFKATGIVESWLPLFLFSILFGLSMDYHLFVLGRIKEAVEHGMHSDQAVAVGIKATASTITQAAAIMVGVALTFAIGRDIGIKQFGFGLAVAVLIDATIVRSILLPASMKLLGERNWYMPRWLDWLPQIRMAE